jgi:hypothetical protein
MQRVCWATHRVCLQSVIIRILMYEMRGWPVLIGRVFWSAQDATIPLQVFVIRNAKEAIDPTKIGSVPQGEIQKENLFSLALGNDQENPADYVCVDITHAVQVILSLSSFS